MDFRIQKLAIISITLGVVVFISLKLSNSELFKTFYDEDESETPKEQSNWQDAVKNYHQFIWDEASVIKTSLFLDGGSINIKLKDIKGNSINLALDGRFVTFGDKFKEYSNLYLIDSTYENSLKIPMNSPIENHLLNSLISAKENEKHYLYLDRLIEVFSGEVLRLDQSYVRAELINYERLFRYYPQSDNSEFSILCPAVEFKIIEPKIFQGRKLVVIFSDLLIFNEYEDMVSSLSFVGKEYSFEAPLTIGDQIMEELDFQYLFPFLKQTILEQVDGSNE